MAHIRPLAQQRHTLHLGNRGRIVLPAEVRHRLDLKQGDRLILSVEADGTLLLQGTRTLAQRLQGMFADLAPGVDLADELLADPHPRGDSEIRLAVTLSVGDVCSPVKSSRSSVPAAASRCGSSPSSPSWTDAVQRILKHLDEPTQPPRLAPARGPPGWDQDFDTRKGDTFALSEPLPEYEFDQRVSA